MIFKHCVILLIGLLFSTSLFSQNENFVEGELLVMLNNKTEIESFTEKVNNTVTNVEFKVKERIARRINVWLLTYNKDNYSNIESQEILNSFPEVLIVQPNHTNIAMRMDSCPTESKFASEQWNLKNTGMSGGTTGADIDACSAWGISTSETTALGDSIVIAVIDNGFFLNHEDLNFFRNYNEIPGNGIDDDGNGYIDDTLGWNTYFDTNRITSRSHGTHVSGIIGAIANNGKGGAGVTWGMKILAIQGSSGLESTVLKSYGYVLEMRDLYDETNGAKGAYVVATNSSFGVDFGDAASYPLWCAFYDSLGSRGILNAAATSNSNTNVDISGDIPTTCISDYLISVTNTTRTDNKATAGYGATSIDIGAPGTQIYSTYPNNLYSSNSGTSQATPHVSGAVAFMYSVACADFMNEYNSNPDSMALEVKKAILDHGDSIASLLGLTVTGKRLNLYRSAYHIRTEGACNFTGVFEAEKELNSMKLFPNPNQGIFSIELNNFKKGIYSYSVIDIAGRLIEKNTIYYNSEIVIIDVTANVEKGVYLLLLSSELGLVKSAKFIVD